MELNLTKRGAVAAVEAIEARLVLHDGAFKLQGPPGVLRSLRQEMEIIESINHDPHFLMDCRALIEAAVLGFLHRAYTAMVDKGASATIAKHGCDLLLGMARLELYGEA